MGALLGQELASRRARERISVWTFSSMVLVEHWGRQPSPDYTSLDPTSPLYARLSRRLLPALYPNLRNRLIVENSLLKGEP